MAIVASIQSGNFTDSTTWGLVNSTSYSNSESVASLVTTSYAGNRSNAFTPGAITISHIAIKIREKLGNIGTLSVCLELDSGDTLVAGTEVTINCADIPETYYNNFVHYGTNWLNLKLAAPVTLSAATAYQVAVKTSDANQLLIHTSAGTNVSRFLITTTTQLPVAGDDIIVVGEYTGLGTSNTHTVVMNNTTTTDYGSATTATATPSLAIAAKGVLNYGTSSGVNYYLKISGHVAVYPEGTLTMGTIATPCPRDSTMTLFLDCASAGQFGLYLYYNSTFIAQGQSRTSGKNIVSTKLTSSIAINDTVVNTVSDTGWLDNDEIVVPNTAVRGNFTQTEYAVLNGNAGVSSFNIDGAGGVGGGFLYAHESSSYINLDVVLLTRNVVITTPSSTAFTFIISRFAKEVNIQWVYFKFFGGSSNKNGILCSSNGALGFLPIVVKYCSALGNGSGNAAYFFNLTSSGNDSYAGDYEISYNSLVNTAVCNVYESKYPNIQNLSVNKIISNNITIVQSPASFLKATMGSYVTNFDNNSLWGCSLYIGNYVDNLLLEDFQEWTINNLSIYTPTSSNGITFEDNYNNLKTTFNNLKIVRGAFRAINVGQTPLTTIKNAVIVGNDVGIYSTYNEYANALTIKDSIICGESGYDTRYNIEFFPQVGAPDHTIYNFENIDFSGTGLYQGKQLAPPTLGNIFFSPYEWFSFSSKLRFKDCIFPAIGNVNETGIGINGIVTYINIDQVAGKNKIHYRTGFIEYDDVVFNSPNTYSYKLTPFKNDERLELKSEYGYFKYYINSGSSATISVAVKEDAGYTGSRARLILKKNIELGITEDVILDTATIASESGWEILTGTTPVVTRNGYLEFTVDCIGSGVNAIGTFTLTGNINNGETITIGNSVYTFQSTLTNVANNVLIGSTAEQTLINLYRTVLREKGAGYLYAANTSSPLNSEFRPISLTPSSITIMAGAGETLTNRNNKYGEVIATSTTALNGSWGAATLTGATGAGSGSINVDIPTVTII